MIRTRCDFGTWFGRVALVLADRRRPRSISRSSEARGDGRAVAASSAARRRRRAVDSPRAMSMVTWLPPTAIASACTRWPPAKTPMRGRAAADVDDDGAHFGLVVDERGEARGIGRRDHGLDVEMAALDGQHRGCATASASAATTCMSTPSFSPTMPRGSLMPRVASSAKPVGSECRTVRPGREPVMLAASSTRCTSPSVDRMAAKRDVGVVGLASPAARRSC